ncbi:MAG: DUF1993 domain-containing protein [Mesorhizobium sp.]|nr:DUF1993 domain-containing protein [Mesorhizobium sp.]
MSMSMFQASVPVYQTMLKNLSDILVKADASAAERKIDPAVLLSARLSPDMLPLTRQVQITTDHAKGSVARLAGREIMKLEDGEASFADLQARLGVVIDHLKGYQPAEIDGSEDRSIIMRLGGRDVEMPGTRYLLHFAMPNFYFHATTAYAILRHNGVPLGKSDFLGRG